MDYQETIDFLYSRLPSLEKKGWGAYKPGLNRVFKLVKLLDDPQEKIPFIHVGGTNGKGSVSAMIASILQEAGYKVGLFTSPHLLDFRERIRINGQVISKEEVIQFVETLSLQASDIQPSFFEYTFAMALQCFADAQVDVAIIEVGLGGRLDCTNIIQPKLCVITNVGLDHQQYLGDTIEEIALEKAGIIKVDTPLVLGKMSECLHGIFSRVAQAQNSVIYHSSNSDTEIDDEDQSLTGFLFENAQTAREASKVLRSEFKLEPQHVSDGIINFRKNSGLRGRLEYLSQDPKIIVDVAHNVDGIRAVLSFLSVQKFNSLHLVIGVSADKDVDGILGLLPVFAKFYFCSAQQNRAMDAGELQERAKINGRIGNAYKSVQEALVSAKELAGKEDLILVLGSVFVVSEVISMKSN